MCICACRLHSRVWDGGLQFWGLNPSGKLCRASAERSGLDWLHLRHFSLKEVRVTVIFLLRPLKLHLPCCYTVFRQPVTLGLLCLCCSQRLHWHWDLCLSIFMQPWLLTIIQIWSYVEFRLRDLHVLLCVEEDTLLATFDPSPSKEQWAAVVQRLGTRS